VLDGTGPDTVDQPILLARAGQSAALVGRAPEGAIGKVLKTLVIDDETINSLCFDTWPAAYDSGRAFRCYRCCQDSQGPRGWTLFSVQ
jgi:hypothetical protein